MLLQVRAVFARHNLLDDFDSWSDISVWHKIRVPPTIFFYDGGAVVSRDAAVDSAAGSAAGSATASLLTWHTSICTL
jgi:hypothetical protein